MLKSTVDEMKRVLLLLNPAWRESIWSQCLNPSKVRKVGRADYGTSLNPPECGGVSEWLNELVLKTSRVARLSRVRISPPPHFGGRIPPSPPNFLMKNNKIICTICFGWESESGRKIKFQQSISKRCMFERTVISSSNSLYLHK